MEFYSWWSSHQFISNRKVFCLRARIPRSSFNFILSPFMKQLLITSSNMVVVLSWCIKLQRAGKLPLQCFWEMLQNQMNGVGRAQLRCSLWLLCHIPWNYLNLELWKFSSFIRAWIFWGSSHSTLPTHDTFKGHHTLPVNQLSSCFRCLNLTILPSAILIRFSAQCCVCLSTFPQKPNVCYLLQRTFWTHSDQPSLPCVGKSFMLSASWAFIVVFTFQRALFVTFVQIWCRTSRLPSPVC